MASNSVVRAERWVFSAVGAQQPWEDASAYRARRVADRFPPALLDRYLDKIGVPPLDGPSWGPGGIVLTRRGAPAQNPVAPTIAELGERMYGDRGGLRRRATVAP